jgi:hypothetical protein
VYPEDLKKPSKPQISRWKEVIKIRAEINEMETKMEYKESIKNLFFEKINEIEKPLTK